VEFERKVEIFVNHAVMYGSVIVESEELRWSVERQLKKQGFRWTTESGRRPDGRRFKIIELDK
jgi:hypothetical protein